MANKISKEEFLENGGRELIFRLMQQEAQRVIEEEEREMLKQAERRRILLGAALKIGGILIK